MAIDESSRTALHGTVYPLARPEYDQGAVADDVSFGRLLLMVARSPDRERSLQQFLRDLHASGSPSYRHWLTPDEFGQRFGAPDDNLQLVSGWLQSHGMKVARVTKSKSMIEFSGTGATIGIIGTNNLNLALVGACRKLFNLPADHAQVVIDGVDPGDSEPPDIEGFLDVEVSGAMAPNASIYYYIATGPLLPGPVALAALRAIDDNNASVISVSYGQCEQLIEESGNQLWAGLWEQAAAQGQTVLVASGDLGPSSCAGTVVPLPNAVEVPGGLTVNGLSSTPWNVSVGGTDFYYADYATGGASISSFWNRANDASLGSLKAPLPEQPWDSGLGLNIVPYLSEPATFPSPATGGGPSNCSQESSDPNTALQTCVAGYPKPAWQQAPGVPSDGMRDLPDISLFAANGANLSAWPICAEPGDCADGTTSPVTLVGGTSSSTPAMAAIMALINQRFGRQGQADYALYALARQSPGTFHDISIGTNDILCPSSEESGGVSLFPGCTVPYPVQYITPLSSYGVYAAGPGYDFASGLGSFDASMLISNWNQITPSPAVTSLGISPLTRSMVRPWP